MDAASLLARQNRRRHELVAKQRELLDQLQALQGQLVSITDELAALENVPTSAPMTTRDGQICMAVLNGRKLASVAAEHHLTRPRVSQIVKANLPNVLANLKAKAGTF